MAQAQKTMKKGRVTLLERLQGTKAFTLGAYKDVHVAHSYASQIRRIARVNVDTTGSWVVKVNPETRTIRVSKPN